jgi:hypothetical protein
MKRYIITITDEDCAVIARYTVDEETMKTIDDEADISNEYLKCLDEGLLNR